MRAARPAPALLLLVASLAAAAPAPDFAGRLPLEVQGWRRPARPQSYDARTLYDYIDGGAELYLSYGFRRALAFFYQKGKDREIKVDVFDMGSSADAFGVFAHGSERDDGAIGQGSEYAAGLLTFWKDRYYVAILGYPETAETRAVVLALGRAVAALVPRTGPRPPLVELLPRPHRVAGSVRWFRHHAWLDGAVAVGRDNLLGVGPGTPGALARYADGAARHVLVLVEHADARRAEEARRTFVTRYLHGQPVARVKERWAGIRRVEQRLVVVLDAPDRATVERTLAAGLAPGAAK